MRWSAEDPGSDPLVLPAVQQASGSPRRCCPCKWCDRCKLRYSSPWSEDPSRLPTNSELISFFEKWVVSSAEKSRSSLTLWQNFQIFIFYCMILYALFVGNEAIFLLVSFCGFASLVYPLPTSESRFSTFFLRTRARLKRLFPHFYSDPTP